MTPDSRAGTFTCAISVTWAESIVIDGRDGASSAAKRTRRMASWCIRQRNARNRKRDREAVWLKLALTLFQHSTTPFSPSSQPKQHLRLHELDQIIEPYVADRMAAAVNLGDDRGPWPRRSE